MKQMGIALANYHDVFTMLPPGDIDANRSALVRGGNAGRLVKNHVVHLFLLPYVDQAGLYAEIDFDVATAPNRHSDNTGGLAGGAWATNINNTGQPGQDRPLSAVVPAFLCPSDTAEGILNVTNNAAHYNVSGGRTNYLPCGGSRGWSTNNSWHGTATNSRTLPDGRTGIRDRGVFGHNGAARFRDFEDGSSNTLAFGEVRQGIGNTSIPGIVNTHHSASWAGYSWISNFIVCHPHSNSTHINNIRYHINGQRNDPGYTSGGTTLLASHHGGAASSAHVGGAHFVLGDGAVKFLNDNIDVSLYATLHYIADGEVVGDF